MFFGGDNIYSDVGLLTMHSAFKSRWVHSKEVRSLFLYVNWR